MSHTDLNPRFTVYFHGRAELPVGAGLCSQFEIQPTQRHLLREGLLGTGRGARFALCVVLLLLVSRLAGVGLGSAGGGKGLA